MQRWMILGALVGTLAMSVAACGPTGGGNPTPPTITHLDIRSFQVEQNKPFLLEADATNQLPDSYDVTFTPMDSTKVALYAEICTGTTYDSPSADTPACEYDSATAPAGLVTHTEGWFTISAAVGTNETIQVCAQSESATPPLESCSSATFTVVASS